MATLDQIIDDFSFLDDWEDRYRYVIELGKADGSRRGQGSRHRIRAST